MSEKVTILPYIPPKKKSCAADNDKARRNQEAHQKHLDSLIREPSGEDDDDLLSETEKNFRDGTRYLKFSFAIDKGKFKA